MSKLNSRIFIRFVKGNNIRKSASVKAHNLIERYMLHVNKPYTLGNSTIFPSIEEQMHKAVLHSFFHVKIVAQTVDDTASLKYWYHVYKNLSSLGI